jgi:hypothetical protein
VRTNLSVKARVGEEKALDGATVQQVLTDNLRNIFYVDEAVPNGLRIDDHDGAMLALVETALMASLKAPLSFSLPLRAQLGRPASSSLSLVQIKICR